MMRIKARLFRSLLLELLETRAVFSASGIDQAWQFSQPATDVRFDEIQSEYARPFEFARTNSADDCPILPAAVRAEGVRPVRAGMRRFNLFSDNMNHRLVGEGEDRPFNPLPRNELTSSSDRAALPPTSGPKLNIDLLPALPAGALVLPGMFAGQGLRDAPRIVLVINEPTGSHPGGTSNPITQVPLAIGESLNVVSPPFRSFTTPLTTTAVDLNSVAAKQFDSLLSKGTAIENGVTSIEFSLPAANVESNGGQAWNSLRSIPDFKSTAPASQLKFDASLAERAAGVASLENLLSDLADNHRRHRDTQAIDSEHPDWRPEHAGRYEATGKVPATTEITFADGGLIAIALTRDGALHEFDVLGEEVDHENEVWIANVGILRAFETGSMAVKEYAGLQNRVSRNEEQSRTFSDLPVVEGEVAEARLTPLLASSSAVLGAMLFGLRRLRQSAAGETPAVPRGRAMLFGLRRLIQ